MSGTHLSERDFAEPAKPKLAILSVDGGGIRGLIPAIVLSRLEQLIAEREPGATLASKFDLIAGTSTGGLIALGLATPDADGRPALDATAMIDVYSGPDAQKIFERPKLERLPLVGTASNLFDPRYGLNGLRETLERHFGEAKLGDSLTGLLLTAYDMTAREPRFLKPWQSIAERMSAVEAGLATAAAPTYFPALEHEGRALVDGGVFASNPSMAALVEALKRKDGPPIHPEDLLVVSIGTGHFERGYAPNRVKGWGALGWILPDDEGESPILSAMFDGQADSADHWAHTLLNHEPGTTPDKGRNIGAGPRYYRWQIDLPANLPLDGVDPDQLETLRECGEALADGRAGEIAAVAEVLAG